MDVAIIFICLFASAVIAVLAILLRRERAARRLSERFDQAHHDVQSDTRAAAQAAQMGRGGGWPAP